MSPAIKFATLENIEIKITSEDAYLIAFESRSFGQILSGELQEVVFDEPKYGGKAINLALKYCKAYGEIQHNRSQCPESFDIKCKEEQHWVDGFISQITEADLGMVHELVAVLYRLDTYRLFDLTCQYIVDYLSFKDYGKFREAFGFQFLFPPYFIRSGEIQDWEQMFDGLECPTFKETYTEFRDKIPFTPIELEIAKIENNSVRVGGNLIYKTENILIQELLIKIEYIERRLNSFNFFSKWMPSTISKYLSESNAHLKTLYDDQTNNDIGEVCSTIGERATTFNVDIMRNLLEGIADSCTDHENIYVIRDKMDKNELIFACEANTYKKKEEELAKRCLANWKSSHEDKIYPWLTYILENCYQKIHSTFCALRGWMSPLEVQDKISKLNNWRKVNFEYMEDENEYQDKDVESEAEVQAEVQAFGSSLRKFQRLAICTAYNFPQDYHQSFHRLQVEMRKQLHLDLLIKDEEMLTFICKRKFNSYVSASGGGTSTISFADEEKEFDTIMEETDEKFGYRGPVVEEAKRKYSLHYKKYHYAMVDETKRQMKLLLDVEKGSLGTEKESMEVEKEWVQVEEGRRKRMRTAAATTS